MDFHLNLGKGHHVHQHAVAIFAQNAGQLKHLFLGPFAGIGEGKEVYRLHLRTPRFISWKPATGLSMPPESSSMALPPVPMGIPPTASISRTHR